MEYPPAFIDNFVHGESEFIAISSALANEMRICELTQNTESSEYKALCLPYQPPTLKEAYEHAKLSGKCLQEGAQMEKRVICCTTGLVFQHKSDKKNHDREDDQEEYSEDEENEETLAKLLISNSNGDVFAHNVYKREDLNRERQRVNRHSNEVMHNFAEKICQKMKPALQYTEIGDLSALNKLLRCQKLSGDSHENRTKEEKKRLGRWQKSIGALKKYKDALAEQLLSIWDVEHEDKSDREFLVEQLPQEMKEKPDHKFMINNWLNLGTVIPPNMTVIYNETENNAMKTTTTDISRNFDSTITSTQEFLQLPQSTQLYDNHGDIFSVTVLEPSQMDNLTLGQIINLESVNTELFGISPAIENEFDMQNENEDSKIHAIENEILNTTRISPRKVSNNTTKEEEFMSTKNHKFIQEMETTSVTPKTANTTKQEDVQILSKERTPIIEEKTKTPEKRSNLRQTTLTASWKDIDINGNSTMSPMNGTLRNELKLETTTTNTTMTMKTTNVPRKESKPKVKPKKYVKGF